MRLRFGLTHNMPVLSGERRSASVRVRRVRGAADVDLTKPVRVSIDWRNSTDRQTSVGCSE